MRGAARKPAEEPPPAKADLDARLAGVLDGQAELVTRATAMLDRCPDPRLLRQLITEVIGWGLHAEEMRAEMARYTAANAGGDSFFELGRAYERSLIQDAAATAAVPGPRHRRSGRWQPGEGQRALFSVKTIPGIAAAAAAFKVLWKHAAHAVTHPAALTAHTVKLAAAATAVPAAGVLIAGAVIVTHASSPSGPSAGAGASVPGWHTSASPIPSGSLIALTKPKPKRAAKGKTLLEAGAPLPVYGPAPQQSSSSPLSSPAPVVSVQAGPATLEVSTTALDLTSLTPETITLSASGAGWVSWKVALPPDPLTGAPQTDLDFSSTHGILQAGQSVTVTVSLDPAQLLDGNLSETFTIGGVSVRATLPPLPVPLPSVPDPAASVLPSGL